MLCGKCVLVTIFSSSSSKVKPLESLNCKLIIIYALTCLHCYTRPYKTSTFSFTITNCEVTG